MIKSLEKTEGSKRSLEIASIKKNSGQNKSYWNTYYSQSKVYTSNGRLYGKYEAVDHPIPKCQSGDSVKIYYLENMEPLTTLFRNVSQVIPLHFDHANLLKANLIFLYCQHKSVI